MKTKILIVEDELLIAENHKDKLRSFGIDHIQIALSELEARETLKSFKPDIVLMDVRLHKSFEGIDFGSELQQNQGLPVIYITAHSDMATLQKILKVEPAGYLSKPVRTSDLHSAITIALRNSNNLETSVDSQVVLQNKGEVIRFAEQDFLFAKSSGNYIQLFITDRKRHVIRMTLEQLINNAEKEAFIRVNRSTVVNLHRVTAFKNKKVSVEDQVFSVSPNLFQAFEEKFNQVVGK